jgi:hypothetical protein
MAVTAFATSTTQAVINTGVTMTNVNVAGVYTWHVDAVNMAAGDTLKLQVFQTVLTGGTARVAYTMHYYGAQPFDDTIKISVPIGNDLTDAKSLQFVLNQEAGTSRAFPNKILKYA